MIGNAPTLNSLWSSLIVEELVRNGCDYFCISPGSRSTPLTLAVAETRQTHHCLAIDERGAAYHALGFARARGRPAVLICTSGTAVASYLPAIVEAAMDGMPMLVLTADRPPELRQTGANQTIQQPHIFGDYTRWEFDLPCPDLGISPAMVLTTIDQACYRSQRAPCGPVHLNCMFREPLAPVGEAGDFQSYLAGISDWLAGQQPFTMYARPTTIPRDETLQQVTTILRDTPNGILVVGKLSSPADRQAVAVLGQKLQWPIFADVTSGLRLGNNTETNIHYYDQLLLSPQTLDVTSPWVVLQIGGHLTSKRLLQFIEKAALVDYIFVENHPFRDDPNHRVSLRIEADVAAFCEALLPRLPAAQRAPLATRLVELSQKVEHVIDAFFDDHAELSEPATARLLSKHIPPDTGLFLASSMPIRDMDMYAVGDGSAVRVAANRGASGIDGTIAAATGFAAGLQRPVTLLLGDLAAIHDLNSLLQVRESRYPMVIIVINNDGGGIFSFLPVAKVEKHFESYFGTPHGLNFQRAAEMFGLDYYQPTTGVTFVASYRSALAKPQHALIEIKTERQQNLLLHKALQEKIIAAISTA